MVIFFEKEPDRNHLNSNDVIKNNQKIINYCKIQFNYDFIFVSVISPIRKRDH